MKFLHYSKRMALALFLLAGVGVFAQTLPPVGVVTAGGSNLVSYAVNAATGEVGQGEVFGGPFSLVAADPAGRFVYAAGGTTLYGATIDAGDGVLTPIPGFAYSIPDGVTAMAVDGSGRFLYIGSPSGVLGASIDPAAGALTAIAGSPFAVSTGVQALVSDGAGKYLYAAGNGVAVLAIDATTGALTPIAGSPFGSGNGSGLAMDPQKRFLFVSADSGIAGYAINGTTGGLTALAGSPFFPGAASAGVSFDGSGRFLYSAQSGGPGSLWGFVVDATSGNLTLAPGAPFSCTPGCNGVAADASGQYAYVISSGGVLAYQIDGVTGALTFINGVSAGATSMALAPAAGSPTATLQSLQITPPNPTVTLGLNQQFTARGTYSDGTQRFLTGSVSWSSSDTGVATISNALGQNGLATTTGSGTTTTTATMQGVTATTTFTVQ